jgi:hypothetical protein
MESPESYRQRPFLPGVLAVILVGVLAGCDRDGPMDTVVDHAADAAVWLGDARKITATLPARVGSFAPTEGADPFFTTYSTGPVFGSSCAYADGGRQLVVRVESGNVEQRGTNALDAGPGGRVTRVHGWPGVVRWSDASRVGQVTFVVARRYVVDVRLVPANGDGEVLRLAESIDTGPLAGLVLDGVSR